MDNLTVEQLIEKYPYLKDMSEYILFTTEEDVNQLTSSEMITINSVEVSTEFLKRILNNDFYFEYALRYFKDDIKTFKVAYITHGDLAGNIHYKKNIIINAIEQLISNRKMILSSDEKQRFEILKHSISFEKFLEKHKGNNFNINIDDIQYSVPIEQIISFMQLPNEQFDDLCFNSNVKEINGILKVHFVYAAFKFFEDGKIFGKFLMPSAIIDHYRDLESLQKVDFQSINRYLITTDTKYKMLHMDSNLEQAIILGMPEDATELEKAIYIYIKMCKLLTYDEEYYAVSQTGVATQKHKNVDYLSSITLDNNKVVCFEFNLIYSKFLNQLGINFSCDYLDCIGENYGNGHANLEFRSGKFLVGADSVTSILRGDLVQAKLNQPLVGLKCINKNQNTQKEFKDALTKMYQLVARRENSISDDQQVEHVQTLDELLEEYSHLTTKVQDVSLNERLSILISKVNSTGMIGIDSFSYVLQLRKILFTEDQRKNNIKVTILRNNEPVEVDKVAMASAIFVINEYGFEENPEHNVYYYFMPNHDLIPITKEYLQSKFDNGGLEYAYTEDPKIPGIVENGGLKNVK